MKRATSWLAMAAAALAAGLLQAAEASVAPGAMEAKAGAAVWPLWDGKESVADYAKRAGIKDVEKTLDLGGGVAMKLTLIPAGKYSSYCRSAMRIGFNTTGYDRKPLNAKAFYLGCRFVIPAAAAS